MMVMAMALVLAAGPVKVASPAWNVVDIKPELAKFYAEQLAQALRNEGFQVTTADDIQTLLGAERQKQLLGCSTSSDSCMAELANALGCDATLTVNLAKLGNSFRGLMKLMSSSDGKVLSAVKLDANSEAQLSDRVEAAAKELARPFREKGVVALTVPPKDPEPSKPEEPVVVARSTRVAPAGWWVPGALGVVAAGVGAFLCVLAAGKYEELRIERDAANAAAFVTQGEGLQASGIVAIAGGSAALVGSLIWLLAGSTTVQPQVALTPQHVSFGLTGRF